jgi:hypothetical protein
LYHISPTSGSTGAVSLIVTDAFAVAVIPVSPEPSPIKLVALTTPTTVSACVGIVVPIPTLPALKKVL